MNKRVRLTNKRLYIEGAEFILTACTIRRNDTGFFYQAELQDVRNERSILICRLEEVEVDW
jgi:hypothetical protein